MVLSKGDTTMLLVIYFKDGSDKTIKCDSFVMTSVDVLVVKLASEKTEFINVDHFGGCNYEN